MEKPIWDIDSSVCLHALYEAFSTCDATPKVAKKLSIQFVPSNGNPKGITHSTIVSAIRRGRARAGLISVGYTPAMVDGLILKFTQGPKTSVRKPVQIKPKPPQKPRTVVRSEPQHAEEEQKVPVGTPDLEPVRLEDGKPATTLTLNESMCRFPIGEPGSPDFAYCGRGIVRGAYCEDHANLSYQPRQKERKKRGSRTPRDEELARIERTNRSYS